MKLSLVATMILSSIGICASAQPQNHAFSVKDDIAMARFSDPSSEQGDFHENDGNAKVSADGRYAAIVTTRGLLESDQIESTVSVFDLDAVDSFLRHPSPEPPVPRVIAAIAARPNREQTIAYAPVIKDLRWSPDAKHLYFRGENSSGAMQLYEASIDGGDSHPLTPADYSVDRFDLTKETVVYTGATVGQANPAQGIPINRDALDVTGYRLMNILFPGQMASYYPETFTMATLHVGDIAAAPHPVPGYNIPDIPMLLHFFPFQLSPDGRQLLTIMPVTNVPDAWKNYEPAPTFEHRRIIPNDASLTSPDNILRPRRYGLIDLATGKVTPLVGGPNALILGYAQNIDTASWSLDGSRVLVTNVFLPLEAKGVPGSSVATLPCAVASVDLPSLHVDCLFSRDKASNSGLGRIWDVAFGRDRDEVLISIVTDSSEQSIRTFRFLDGNWKLISSSPASDTANGASEFPKAEAAKHTKLHVFIKQSLNEPPTLWAKDPDTGKERQLWDPNPQLKRLCMGEASVYRWKDHSGTEWTGGLVKPVGYIPGKRYPLVIQMYQFKEREFLTDGTDPSAFAARHLASVGFVVLQIRKRPSFLSEADPQTHLEAYRSAIESLSKSGMVDPDRVGAVGFSWTCWYVINALIKAPKLFAAATIADGLDNSYMQYVLFGPGPANTHEQMDTIRGVSPFGPGLYRWVDEAPGFHLDQVQTPVRIEAINPTSVLQEWELYGSLYMQHKPVDLIYFPEGTHIHQRPLERLESQQGNVDWLRFWLQGYEDPDPNKNFRYQRWREMKKDVQTEGALGANR